MSKRVLITGVTGQDGAYLARLLLSKGYEVHGIKRRTSLHNTQRLDAIYQNIHELDRHFMLHYSDLTDSLSLLKLIEAIQPEEIYNLAAQSHVGVSYDAPVYTANTDALGCLRLLEVIRILKMEQSTRFYHASTSELFDNQLTEPLNENSPFRPRSPYATAKLYAYWTTVNYRLTYDIYAVNGILFNHESPVRGETFVTRKITNAVAQIKLKLTDCLYIGNLNACRDWGYAGDYAKGMWLMLQQPEPDDYVLATGRCESVRFFVENAFACADINIEWKGEGVDEIGIDRATGKTLVRIDPVYFRPLEGNPKPLGDASKARKRLGWQPEVSLEQIIEKMVAEDLRRTSNPGVPFMQ